MTILKKSIFLLSGLFLLACNTTNNLLHSDINNASACTEKGGTWYNNKCWAGYEDEGISKADIDAVVAKAMKKFDKAQVTVNGERAPLVFFMPEIDGNDIALVTIYKDKAGEKTIISQFKEKALNKEKFSAESTLFNLNLMKAGGDDQAVKNSMLGQGNLEIKVLNLDEFRFDISGTLKDDKTDKKYRLSFKTDEDLMGAGLSTFEVKGNEAHLSGELGTKTYHQLKNIIEHHPEVKTIVLGQINGSLNDAVNMHTGRILREAGLNTKVLKDSEIASGGVDLFCAGKERIVEKGAKIGIHSWCCVNNLTAIDVPKDHPAHKYQLEYFTMCLGKERGPAFYFRTLEAAPFNGIHWMADDKIKEWKIATRFIE